MTPLKAVEYNPFMFELARHSRGLSVADLSLSTGIPRRRMADIEKGEVEPTAEEMDKLAKVLNYPLGFFRQYPATRFALGQGCMLTTIPINYRSYKVMRG